MPLTGGSIMARISLTPRRTLGYRAVSWICRRRFGADIEPLAAASHNTRVLLTTSRMEQSVAKWNTADAGLKTLAVMATAARVDCSWCMDFGYWESFRHGMDLRKLRDVPGWRESTVYTPAERDVMEYAEAMTSTPPTVDDALFDRLRRHLDEPRLVELTAIIAVENLRARMNSALGITSQGFKDRCDIAGPDPAAAAGASGPAGP
ncbi:carboxymuconolactone decarboxylase family protein [Streptomyces varsoviensis]|uniref:carboxymuconolactone decarboxylase family protein n=1 Tax=Streptomyces varsoviensis TaxID=67373 RepID=UPI0033D25BC8